MNIIMHTSTVLNTLKENKEKHIKEYEEQIAGWKTTMEEYRELLLNWSENGGNDKKPKEPTKPINYVETYDEYIKMLIDHTDIKITLEQYEYEQLINDNFGWKAQFNAVSNVYNNH